MFIKIEDVKKKSVDRLHDLFAFPAKRESFPDWSPSGPYQNVSSLLLKRYFYENSEIESYAKELKESCSKRLFFIETKGFPQFNEDSGYPEGGRFIVIVDLGLGEAARLVCKIKPNRVMDVDSLQFLPACEFDEAVLQAKKETLTTILDIGLRYVDLRSGSGLAPDDQIDALLSALNGRPELKAALNARMIGEKIESEVSSRDEKVVSRIERNGF